MSANRIGAFTPAMPATHWTRIAPFVRAAVLESHAQIPYSTQQLMKTVAAHVHWCVFVAGLELDRAEVFDRAIIVHAVHHAERLSEASRGNTRSQLLRVAEILLPDAHPARLPALSSAEPSAPYTQAELNSFNSWARTQPTEVARQSAAALVTLGAGAGLAARELAAVVPEDIVVDDEGTLIHVRGERPRTVPLLRSWEELLEQTRRSSRPGVPLFRPGHGKFYPNIVTNFVARSAGIGLKPQSPRLRATWIVTLLASGAPPLALLEAAGVSSLEALTRYMRFVPPPSPGAARFALRHAELQDAG
ncbi:MULTISPECIES: site-specific integrase [Agromyces]|jgi:integrase|uniref:site-specific integrase n=1 Tax=Agromyces TaxID=33877 RepID=UPI00203BF2CE|nr:MULTISPECIES: site-specific integrase [Agromyces]MCM3658204.1 site-specific integrase [Agromyces mediolanus]GLU88070.1 hypothetical protein Agsp01_03250 [Agromyces sp. NBRC 114283]